MLTVKVSDLDGLKELRSQYKSMRVGKIHADGTVCVAGSGGGVLLVVRVIGWSGVTETAILAGRGLSKAVSLGKSLDRTVVPYCVVLVDDERAAYMMSEAVKGAMGGEWELGGKGIYYCEHDVVAVVDAVMMIAGEM